jgi:hypothetical protein
VQISAAIVLVLAANTTFNGFPRLAAVMAADDWFPHRLTHRGFRLAYSNGILAIGTLAIVLVVAFNGDTHALIPLFAVGVFLCFTLSQAGMVRHWQRVREGSWRRKAAVNGAGAVVTGLVTLIVLATKFLEGAWIVVVFVCTLVAVFYAVHRHYETARRLLRMERLPELRHTHPKAIVPVDNLHRPTAVAIEYAESISDDVVAVHVAAEEASADFAQRWRAWAGDRVPLQVLPSPYREVISPLVQYIKERAREGRVTVVVPTLMTKHLWEESLHNQLEYALTIALIGQEGVVVTSVPVRLGD